MRNLRRQWLPRSLRRQWLPRPPRGRPWLPVAGAEAGVALAVKEPSLVVGWGSAKGCGLLPKLAGTQCEWSPVAGADRVMMPSVTGNVESSPPVAGAEADIASTPVAAHYTRAEPRARSIPTQLSFFHKNFAIRSNVNSSASARDERHKTLSIASRMTALRPQPRHRLHSGIVGSSSSGVGAVIGPKRPHPPQWP